MGAWGFTSFENDPAMDWISEFEKKPDLDTLEKIFSDIIERNNFIEVDEGSIVLAAADVVAAIRGCKSNDYPSNIRVFEELEVNKVLIDDASKAARKVTESDESELKQLWLETDDYERWRRAVDELLKRLVP